MVSLPDPARWRILAAVLEMKVCGTFQKHPNLIGDFSADVEFALVAQAEEFGAAKAAQQMVVEGQYRYGLASGSGGGSERSDKPIVDGGSLRRRGGAFTHGARHGEAASPAGGAAAGGPRVARVCERGGVAV